jgi:membrane protease YdiL (CAAX protease family)
VREARDKDTRAPLLHTALLIALIVSVAVTGALLSAYDAPLDRVPRAGGGGAALALRYGPILVVQWSLLLYVCRIGRPRSALGPLIGMRWGSVTRAFGDIGLATVGWLMLRLCELGWKQAFGARQDAAIVAMLPHSGAEKLGWWLVAASVGFSEEVVYRGYLQTQLTAFTGRAALGIAMQAVLFGVAHGNQGLGAMVRIGLYGLALGVLAQRRRSLIPGIVCHVGTDLASGLLTG